MALTFHNADHRFRCPEKRKLRKWVTQFLEESGKQLGELAVVFCSDEYLLKVNQEHLNHDFYTDIITFDYCENDTVSGDILLSIDRVKENAKEHNELFFNELLRVIIHGHLHLVGFSDKTTKQKSTMRSMENHWIERFYQLPS